VRKKIESAHARWGEGGNALPINLFLALVARVGLVGALGLLSGCGLVAGINRMNAVGRSEAAYKACLAANPPNACESARLAYQADVQAYAARTGQNLSVSTTGH
jgi:hypothetical protein